MVKTKQSQALAMNLWNSHHWSGSRRKCNFQRDRSMLSLEVSPHPLNQSKKNNNHKQRIKSPQTQQEQMRDKTGLGGRRSQISWEWFRRLKLAMRIQGQIQRKRENMLKRSEVVKMRKASLTWHIDWNNTGSTDSPDATTICQCAWIMQFN